MSSSSVGSGEEYESVGEDKTYNKLIERVERDRSHLRQQEAGHTQARLTR